jgi:hypothetical protein
MRASEFIAENASVASTTAGGIAPVSMPLGAMQKRNGGSFFTGAKYSNEPFPNTPDWMKKGKKKRAR